MVERFLNNPRLIYFMINFIGRSREYNDHLEGEVPKDLERLVHRLRWPIYLESTPNIHLACYFGEKNYANPRAQFPYDMPHPGLDIQANQGTPILLPTTGRIVKCKVDKIGGLTVGVYDEENNLAYVFAHLDARQPPCELIEDTHTKWNSPYFLEAGKPIGKIGKWNYELPDFVNIPGEVLAIYGREFHHVHFEIMYINPRQKKPRFIEGVYTLNPLLLLQKLKY